MDDMAAWTQVIWKHVIHMLEHGQSDCSVPHNPLFITCNNKNPTNGVKPDKSAKMTGIPLKLMIHGLTLDDIMVERVHRGIRFRASQKLKEYIQQRRDKHQAITKLQKEKQLKSNQMKADSVLTIPESYAKFGWSMAVGDLNNDGREDLAIGAPGHGSKFASQDGRVFIVWGTDEGLPLNGMADVNSVANVTVAGPQGKQSRFGSSIAIVDLNLDGVNDIAIGAPNLGSTSTPLQYNGFVYVYYGSKEDLYRFTQVNMTISCKDTFCNNGWSLTSGDLNGDGHSDLILGSSFAPAGGQQRGFFGAVFASSKYKAMTTRSVDSLDWIQKGLQDYAWFGSDMMVKEHPSGQHLLLVSQPTYRNCTQTSCTYSSNDTQSEGQLYMYYLPTGSVSAAVTMSGTHNFQSFGASSDVGRPLPGGDTILAVAATGEDVQGKVVGINTEFTQAGVVHLLNITKLTAPFEEVATFAGDRRYSRFGAKVKFADLNMDGLDDLIITAPFRTDDITEEVYAGEEGKVYIFMGGEKFPKGDKALFDCGGLPLIEPCPGEKASYELSYGEDKARFGSNIAVLKSKNAMQLIVTAIHGNTQNGRLTGAITIYKFSRS